MKIAVFHELYDGGALRAAEALRKELEAVHAVSIFSINFRESRRGGLASRFSHDLIDLVRLALLHWKMAERIDAGGFDLVLVHPSQYTQSPFLLSFLKTPSVYYCQEPLRIVYDPFFKAELDSLPLANHIYEWINRWWRKQIDAFNVSHADKILCNSRYSQEKIRSAYRRKAEVCYLGVDIKLFHPRKIAKKFDIFFFGSPDEIEGYDLLLDAQSVSTRKWRVEYLKRDSRGQGISDKELVKKINQSRLVVCLARNEPFGLTVLEAGACGIPVIAVDEGGYKETVIEGKTGCLVERDPKKLAAMINRFLTNKAKMEDMGKAARKNIESNWTWEKSGKRLETLLSVQPKKNSPNRLLIVSALLFQVFAVAAIVGTFRQTRALFGPALISGSGIVSWTQYQGYPMYYETILFWVVVGLPIVAWGAAWLFSRRKK